jgi:hypothetical protein
MIDQGWVSRSRVAPVNRSLNNPERGVATARPGEVTYSSREGKRQKEPITSRLFRIRCVCPALAPPLEVATTRSRAVPALPTVRAPAGAILRATGGPINPSWSVPTSAVIGNGPSFGFRSPPLPAPNPTGAARTGRRSSDLRNYPIMQEFGFPLLIRYFGLEISGWSDLSNILYPIFWPFALARDGQRGPPRRPRRAALRTISSSSNDGSTCGECSDNRCKDPPVSCPISGAQEKRIAVDSRLGHAR